MKSDITIGIIAPSSVVPQVELQVGVRKLQSLGFSVKIHPQVKKKFAFFAGSDSERAEGFLDFAYNPEIDALWCARGGYGAQRLLPLLERATHGKGMPEKKLLIGFSDITVLMEFVRTKWQWSTLHAPMVANHRFSLFPKSNWKLLFSWISKIKAKPIWSEKPLRLIYSPNEPEMTGMLIGGNLSVWVSLIGTRYAPQSRNKILFFEDISETPARIDRMIQQLDQAGGFEECKGIILGDFIFCEDVPPSGLVKIDSAKVLTRALRTPKKSELHPIRSKITQKKAFEIIFTEIGKRYQIPVFAGFPVGHGENQAAVPLGSHVRIQSNYKLDLISWDWFK